MWLLRLPLVLSAWEQRRQRKCLSFSWTCFVCLLSLQMVLKALEQMRHWNGLSFSLTLLLCLSTQLLVLKSWEQMRQWKDLSFSWTFLMWPLRWVLDLKALREQMWHWKVLSFSWTNFTWQLTACLSLNDLSQMWQRNSLWFWWTLLMWFRRVFCSLGTGHKLNTGRGWNGLERIPVHRWDILEDLASVRSFVREDFDWRKSSSKALRGWLLSDIAMFHPIAKQRYWR